MVLDASFLDIFNMEVVANDAEVQQALRVVSHLEAEVWHALLYECLNRPFALEFVLAGIEEKPFRRYLHEATHSLPTSIAAYPSSLVGKVLQRVAAGLAFLYAGISVEIPPAIQQYHVYVRHATTVLSSLASIDVDAMLEARLKDMATTSPSRRKETREKGFSEYHPLDTTITALGYNVPCSKLQWDILGQQILGDLKEIMEITFPLLRSENLLREFRALYLSEAHSTASQLADPLDYVRGISSSLAVTGAKGFGPWQVHLSSPASRYLQSERRRSSKDAEIIVRKLQDLSRGIFTKDSQKKLKGFDHINAEIFSCWVTGDIRLIYYIDCIDNPQEQGDIQAIRVTHIVSHAKMDNRMKSSLEAQLTGRPKEILHRCRERSAPSNSQIYTPVSFPRLPDMSITVMSPKLPLDPNSSYSQDADMLGLQQYVLLSQGYLSALITGKDMVLPITLSAEEREIIEYPGSTYVTARSGTGKTTAMMFKMISVERAWHMSDGLLRKPRQIFLTKSPALAFRVKEYYEKLIASLEVAHLRPQDLANVPTISAEAYAQRTVLRAEDINSSQQDLPENYNALVDQDFPLFTTFEKFFSMLEVDVFNPRAIHKLDKHADVSYTVATSQSVYHDRLRFDSFLVDYWRHFPSDLIKRLDPAVVFSQFQGVIKGSEEAARTATGYLDRDAYVLESRSTTSSLDETQRTAIYNLFERYQKLLRQKYQEDEAGRAFSLLQGLRCGCSVRQRADFLYVDEVQDILLLDALVLRSICANPAGLFWAGDTAQTISAGSSFRFNELKALMYRADEQLESHTVKPTHPPQQFHLNVNYRSHHKIVNLAASIVRILVKLWPSEVDKINEETAKADGPLPLFLSDDENGTFVQLLSSSGTMMQDFGAEQCILVRNHEARRRLEERIGKIAIILTVGESKGLEFNDVFIVDIFQDSGLQANDWRKVIDVYSAQNSPNASRSACIEMKLLYVAITRARQNVWIFDSSPTGQPLKNYWKLAGLISTEVPTGGLHLQEHSSSHQDWEARAWKLLDDGLFDAAALAFDKAGRMDEANDARAYALEEAAITALGERRRDANKQCRTAAESLLCRASAASMPAPKKAFYLHAGQCFRRGGLHADAASAFYTGGHFEKAALEYLAASDYETAVDIAQDHRHKMLTTSFDRIIEQGRRHFLTQNMFEKAEKLFDDDFVAMRLFVDQTPDLLAVKAEMLLWHQDFLEAAEVFLDTGNDRMGAQLLLQDCQSRYGMSLLFRHILSRCREDLAFGVSNTMINRAQIRERLEFLLATSSKVPAQFCTADDMQEMSIYRAMLTEDISDLKGIVRQQRTQNDDFMQLLCLDHLLAGSLKLGAGPLVQITETLSLLAAYVLLLQRVIRSESSIHSPLTRRLLCVKIDQSFRYTIPSGTFLQLSAESHAHNKSHKKQNWTSISRAEFSSLVTRTLDHRLTRGVVSITKECVNAKELQPLPCHPNALDHQYGSQWRVGRVSAFIQAIYVMSLTKFDNDDMQSWIAAFCRLIFTGPHMRNHIPLRILISAQNSPKSLKTLLDTCSTVVSTIDFGPNFLDRFAQALIFFDYLQWRARYLERVPCVRYTPKPATRHVTQSGAYAAYDIAEVLFGDPESVVVHGVDLMRQISKHRLKVDLALLCYVIEKVCVTAIVAMVYKRSGSFHSVVAPRLRLLRVLQEFSITDLVTIDRNLLVTLREQVMGLKETVLRPLSDTRIHYHDHGLQDLSVTFKERFADAILGFVCLFGINGSPDIALQEYLAGTWPQALTELCKEDLIELVDESLVATAPLIPLHDLRRIQVLYSDVSDIPKILDARRHPKRSVVDSRGPLKLVKGTAMLKAAATPAPIVISGHIQAPTASSLLSSTEQTTSRSDAISPRPEEHIETHDQACTEAEITEPGALASSSLTMAQSQGSPDIMANLDSATRDVLSKFFIKAKRRYRRGLALHPVIPIAPMDPELHSIFGVFHETARKAHWEDNQIYALLYRGIVPSVSYSLDHIITSTSKDKAAAKTAFKKDGSGNFANERLTQATSRLKHAYALKKDLAPSSQFHLGRNVGELRQRVLRVVDLQKENTSELTVSLLGDLQFAVSVLDRIEIS